MDEFEEVRMILDYTHNEATRQYELPRNTLTIITPFGDQQKGVVLAGYDYKEEIGGIDRISEMTIPADKSLAAELRTGLKQLTFIPAIIIDSASLTRLTAEDPSLTVISEPSGETSIFGLSPSPLKAVVVNTMIPNG